MDFGASDFKKGEDFWYKAIRENVNESKIVVLNDNSSPFIYSIEPKYPKFICRVKQDDRVVDVQTRLYFRPGQWIENRKGRIGIVQGLGSYGRSTPVKWSPNLLEDTISAHLRALKQISIGLICNDSFSQCKKDKMRITLETKSLTNRMRTQWLVIIQRSDNQMKWIRLANLEPMKDTQFEYWWARPENNEWKLLRPATYTYIHDFWETRIIRDPVQGVSNFPSGLIQNNVTNESVDIAQQNSILKAIRNMFQKRHLLRPNAKKPIPIRMRALQRSFSDILDEIQKEGIN